MSERSQFRGASVKNRRRGLQAHRTRMENAMLLNNRLTAHIGEPDVFSAYDSFEKEVYGGQVERTVIREPFDQSIQPQEISFATAAWEISGFAEVFPPDDSVLKEYYGKQFRYLLTVNDLFMYPSFNGALAELLDEGATIRTKKAAYRLGNWKLNEAEKLAA